MLQITRQELAKLVVLFLSWRVILFASSYFADAFLVYAPSFPYADGILASSQLPRWLYSWGNFDGVHYLTIAEHGYKGFGLIQAFFPVYPLLIKILSLNAHTLLLTALSISNIAALLSLVMLYVLLKEVYSATVAFRACIVFILFPTAFYLGAVYNESLFMLLVLGSFWASLKRKWLLAGLLAGFASATRIVGVFVVIAVVTGVLMELYTQQKNIARTYEQLRRNAAIAWILLGLVGLLFYMIYLWQAYSDPLYFMHVQSEFGSGREEHIILLPQTLWRAYEILLTVPHNLRYLTYIQEFVYTIGFCIVLALGLKHRYKIPYAWTVFSFLAILLPTTTGTLSSMPRYVLVAFPFFVILAQQNWPRYIWACVYISFAIVLVFNTVLFIQGYWIA